MSTDVWQNLAQRLDSNAVRLYQHADRQLAEFGRDNALAAEVIRSVDLNINRGEK